jgi:tetratricopeptide (TPR) repeat protein
MLLLGWLAPWLSALGFAHAQVGSVIENVEMPTLAGNRHPLLTNATANVFIFFKPGQEHSRSALKELATVEKELAGKSVHWVAVVSDRIPKPDAEAEVKEAGIKMPVLVDAGDTLYGKLGVALEPVVGVTDQDRKLIAYQPFTKVNFAAVIRARVRHLLKEIDDRELAAVLDPPAAVNGNDAATAQRRLKLAEKLAAAKSYEKALESVNLSLEKDPGIAAAHALRGHILAAQGKLPEAIEAFGRALKLDPQDARALEGMKACRETRP